MYYINSIYAEQNIIESQVINTCPIIHLPTNPFKPLLLNYYSIIII